MGQFTLLIDEDDRAYMAPFSLLCLTEKSKIEAVSRIVNEWITPRNFGDAGLPECVIEPSHAMCDVFFFRYVRRDQEQLEELGVPVEQLIAAYNKVVQHLKPSSYETMQRDITQSMVLLKNVKSGK